MARSRGKAVALPVQHSGMTVEEAVAAFLERDLSHNTLRNFRADLVRFCEAFEGRPVASIQPEEVGDYLGSLKSRGKGKASPATVNRHRATLHAMFGGLVKQEELETNPVSRVERRREPERLPQPMTREQLETFYSRIQPLRERALFSLLYRSGLRVDEALSLGVGDVNLEQGTIRILGKGGYERVGYLSEETRPLLRRYLRERGNPRTGPLFASRQGRLSYAQTRVLFRRYAAGLQKRDGRPVTIHQLRHTFGSERAGRMDALVLRDLMGHRTIRTTMQYARVNPERTEQAFRTFDRGN